MARWLDERQWALWNRTFARTREAGSVVPLAIVARASDSLGVQRADSGLAALLGGLIGDNSSLGMQMNARFESKLQRTRNERCTASQYFSVAAQCNSGFQPNFDLQFNVRTGGSIADRLFVNVDYDTQREFRSSDNINIFYQGKSDEFLQRLEVGNVSFAPPQSQFITSGIPQGNYGFQAIGQLGPMRFRGILAQQQGNIPKNYDVVVGDRTVKPDNTRTGRLPGGAAPVLLHRRSAAVRQRVPEHRPAERRADARAGRSAARDGAAAPSLCVPAAAWRAAQQSQRAAIPDHRRPQLARRADLRAAAGEQGLLHRPVAALDRAPAAAEPAERASRRRVHTAHRRPRHRDRGVGRHARRIVRAGPSPVGAFVVGSAAAPDGRDLPPGDPFGLPRGRRRPATPVGERANRGRAAVRGRRSRSPGSPTRTCRCSACRSRGTARCSTSTTGSGRARPIPMSRSSGRPTRRSSATTSW